MKTFLIIYRSGERSKRPTVKGLSQILANLWGDKKTVEEIAVLYDQI